jgi:hypothetical protein
VQAAKHGKVVLDPEDGLGSEKPSTIIIHRIGHLVRFIKIW